MILKLEKRAADFDKSDCVTGVGLETTRDPVMTAQGFCLKIAKLRVRPKAL